jgi:hypothetical protein
MVLPESAADGLIPPGVPPIALLSPDVLVRSGGIEDDQQRRSYLWAMAILVASSQSLPTRTTHVSAGFIYVGSEALLASPYEVRQSFVFGAYALIKGPPERPQEILTIFLGERVFPLVITYGTIELHGQPPFVSTDSSACWVKNKGTHASWTYGILTCRHVVQPFGHNSAIPLTASPSHAYPTVGTLGDIDECTIDAAVVEIDPNAWPSGLSVLTLCRNIGLKAQVHGTGPVSSLTGRVLRVYQDPFYSGNMIGHRVITDRAGQPGDSGSLITEHGTGCGVGIYMGSIPDGSGGHDGLYQDLAQAVDNFALTLHL